MITKLFQNCPNDKDLSHLIEEAYRITDSIYGIDKTVEYGKDFEWPAAVFSRDHERAMGKKFSLELMAAERHRESAITR